MCSGSCTCSEVVNDSYSQMEVDEGSKPYVTINTHCGLYQYQHMPYVLPQHQPCGSEQWTWSFNVQGGITEEFKWMLKQNKLSLSNISEKKTSKSHSETLVCNRHKNQTTGFLSIQGTILLGNSRHGLSLRCINFFLSQSTLFPKALIVGFQHPLPFCLGCIQDVGGRDW